MDPTRNDRITNPLKTFVFTEKVAGAEDMGSGELAVYFASWKRTYRWATGGVNPQEDFMELDEYVDAWTVKTARGVSLLVQSSQERNGDQGLGRQRCQLPAHKC